MPIDGIAKVEIFKSEQIKTLAAYFFCLADNLRALVRKRPTQQLDHSVYGFRGKKEADRCRPRGLTRTSSQVEPHAVKQCVPSFRELLPAAVQEHTALPHGVRPGSRCG